MNSKIHFFPVIPLQKEKKKRKTVCRFMFHADYFFPLMYS